MVKGVSLGKHTLRAVVGVGAVAVLEEHGVAARIADCVNAQRRYLVDLRFLVVADLGHQLKAHLRRQATDSA